MLCKFIKAFRCNRKDMEVGVYFILELTEAQVAFITLLSEHSEQSVEDICPMKLDIIYPRCLLCYLLKQIRMTHWSSSFMPHWLGWRDYTRVSGS